MSRGSRVFIHGASGAVGLAAVQLARLVLNNSGFRQEKRGFHQPKRGNCMICVDLEASILGL